MPLHPDALVVRGGVARETQALRRKVEAAIEDGFGPVASVFCDNEMVGEGSAMSLHRLCDASDVAHGKVQVTTVRRLEEAGFTLELDVSDGQPSTHHHVVLDDPVQESTLRRFIDTFDEPIVNPTGGKRRRSS